MFQTTNQIYIYIYPILSRKKWFARLLTSCDLGGSSKLFTNYCDSIDEPGSKRPNLQLGESKKPSVALPKFGTPKSHGGLVTHLFVSKNTILELIPKKNLHRNENPEIIRVLQFTQKNGSIHSPVKSNMASWEIHCFHGHFNEKAIELAKIPAPELGTSPIPKLSGSTIATLPSGKHTKNYGKSPFSIGKLTISMAIFNSKLLVYQRVSSEFPSSNQVAKEVFLSPRAHSFGLCRGKCTWHSSCGVFWGVILHRTSPEPNHREVDGVLVM